MNTIINRCTTRRITTTIILVFLVSLFATSLIAQDYGYLIADTPECSVWWAEGMYKIMKDDPVPQKVKEGISISSAINEYEPFQIVLRPKKRMDNVRVEVSELIGAYGFRIFPQLVSICHVGYVKVTTPTDQYGKAGDWPDPLPPYDGPFSVNPGENHPLWLTVSVQSGATNGPYEGTVTITSDNWKKEIPLHLNVYSFSLPSETHIRSSFGVYTDFIRRYQNLKTPEESEKVIDLYMQNFKEHRVCPTSPLSNHPITFTVTGAYWKGGEFVSTPVHRGKRAVKVADQSVSSNVDVQYDQKIAVESNKPYKLLWYSKTEKEGQQYTALIQCYNAEGANLPAKNQLKVYKGSATWKQDTLDVKGFLPEVRTISINLFPTFRDEIGSEVGTAYFDDVVFTQSSKPENLIEYGDFEMPVDNIAVEVNFSQFDIGAKKYLDELGFNSFNLDVTGLGGGTFYSRQAGVFAGFVQGTPEYDVLFGSYLKQIQDHLEENKWLGKEYIYWFDEPNEKDYPFVREGMINIHKAAPKLRRFITEHQPGPDIMDVSEVSCTIFHRVEPKIVSDLVAKGREFWSYLCTGPKGPWVTLFTDHPAINLRMWLWMSFKYQLTGILVWSANYWNSETVFPKEAIQNPWEDPMSYTVGYGSPYGQVRQWGNGDGRFLYPPNKDPNNDKRPYLCGPVNSIRWEILREGVEDYEYLYLLQNAIKNAKPDQQELVDRGKALLNFPETMFKDGKDYTKNPLILLEYREKIAGVLNGLISEFF